MIQISLGLGRLAVLLLSTYLLSAPARAELIRIVADGTYNNGEGPGQLLPVAVFSNTWHLELIFEDDIADSLPANPGTGLYPGALQSLQLRVGGETFGLWPNSEILLFNDQGTTDLWIASTSEDRPSGSEGPQTYDEIRLVFVDNNLSGGPAGAFASDALVAPPVPYDWSLIAINYVVRDVAGTQLAYASAVVSDANVQTAVVPLPASAGLLATALAAPAAVVAGRRRLGQVAT